MGWIERERERGCCRSACRCAHATSDTHTHTLVHTEERAIHSGSRSRSRRRRRRRQPASPAAAAAAAAADSTCLLPFASTQTPTQVDAAALHSLSSSSLSPSPSLTLTPVSGPCHDCRWHGRRCTTGRHERKAGFSLPLSPSVSLSRSSFPPSLCLSPTDSRLLPRFSQSCGITPCCMSSSGKGTVMQEKEAAGTSLASHEGSLPVSLDLRLARTSAT